MIIAMLILALQSSAPAETPSLAEVARKERARQNTTTSSTTFTNESLGIPVAPPPPPANKTTDAAKPTETKPAATPAVRDEAWWRDAFAKARDEVKRADDRTKVLQLELNQLNMDLLNRSDIYDRENVLGPKISAKTSELATAQKEADQARAKVTQLEDDLRHAGGPPGWAR